MDNALNEAFENYYKYLMSTWEFDCDKIHDSLKKKYPNYKPEFINCMLAFDSFICKINPLIDKRKFIVHESADFLNDLATLPDSYKETYKIIKNNLEMGIDNSKYCSRQHLNEAYKDNMYRHHGIYHMHFKEQREDRKDDRTNELIFFMIKDSSIYMITIKDHDYFFDLDIFDIINNNWPRLLIKLDNIVTEPPPDADENTIKLITEQNASYAKYRDKKILKSILDKDINPMFILNDKSVIMGCNSLGVNSIGFEIALTRQFISRKKTISDISKIIKEKILFNQYYHPVDLAIYDNNFFALRLVNSVNKNSFIFLFPNNEANIKDLLVYFPVLEQLAQEQYIEIDNMQETRLDNFRLGYSLIILNEIFNDIQLVS